jgi:tetratricopeptide (TPR) repeat protein
VLDRLGALVEQSLLREEDGPDGEPRFLLLATVREFALEQLAAAGEAAAVRAAHADYYLQLAEAAAPELSGPEQAAWLNRLDDDLDNLRAALAWVVGRHDRESEVRLAVALTPYWEVRGYLSEGRRWLAGAVRNSSTDLPSSLRRARALLSAGRLAFWQVDLAEATAHLEECQALARTLGDSQTLADALTWLGAVRQRERAYPQSRELLAQSLPLHEALGDSVGAAWALHLLGSGAVNQGAYRRAVPYLEESLRRSTATGNVRAAANTGMMLGSALTPLGETGRVAALFGKSLTDLHAIGDRSYLRYGLLTAAWVNAQVGQPIRAARLLGAAETLREAIGASLSAVNRDTLDHVFATMRRHLTEDALALALTQGRMLTVDEAIDEATATALPLAVAGTTPPENS